MTEEVWVPVVGNSRYEVSNFGRVRNARTHHMLSQRVNHGNSAMVVTLHYSTRRNFQRSVHRLVGSAFIGPLPNGKETCHSDGNFRNNLLSNLRYDTRLGNAADQAVHGTLNKGERNGRSKLIEKEVLEIRRSKLQTCVLASHFGVSKKTVQEIRAMKKWSHI